MTTIAISTWRRDLPASLDFEPEIYALAPYYVDAVEQAGAQAVMLPWSSDPETAAQRLAPFDGLLLSGGGDLDPAAYGSSNTHSLECNARADASDTALLHAALEQGKPVLAICRGFQLLNVTLGGSLRQHIWDLSEHHPSKRDTGNPDADAESYRTHRHPVDLTEGSTLQQLYGAQRISVNSLHHQAIERLGDSLNVAGTCPDGIVEAVEHVDGKVLGVQWHPERTTDEGHHVLFDWLAHTVCTRPY